MGNVGLSWQTQEGIAAFLGTSAFLTTEPSYKKEDIIDSFLLGMATAKNIEINYFRQLFKQNLEYAQSIYQGFAVNELKNIGVDIISIYLEATDLNIFDAIYVLEKKDILEKRDKIYQLFNFFQKNPKDFILKASLIPNINLNSERLILDGYFWEYKKK